MQKHFPWNGDWFSRLFYFIVWCSNLPQISFPFPVILLWFSLIFILHDWIENGEKKLFFLAIAKRLFLKLDSLPKWNFTKTSEGLHEQAPIWWGWILTCIKCLLLKLEIRDSLSGVIVREKALCKYNHHIWHDIVCKKSPSTLIFLLEANCKCL